jgi:large subunit ribosomal protein L16
MKGVATRGNYVVHGEYGLQSFDFAWISAKQIEAGRVAAMHYLKGEGRIHIRIFPDKPVTSIPLESRLGKGKGEPEYYAAVVKPGTVLYEISGVDEMKARETLSRIAHKMPIKTKMIKRRPRV